MKKVTRWHCINCEQKLAYMRAEDGSDPQVCVECRANSMHNMISKPGIPLDSNPWPDGTVVTVAISSNDRNMNDLDGLTGLIRGIQGEFPVLGRIYIVEFRNMISEQYPYYAMCLPQGCLRVCIVRE